MDQAILLCEHAAAAGLQQPVLREPRPPLLPFRWATQLLVHWPTAQKVVPVYIILLALQQANTIRWSPARCLASKSKARSRPAQVAALHTKQAPCPSEIPSERPDCQHEIPRRITIDHQLSKLGQYRRDRARRRRRHRWQLPGAEPATVTRAERASLALVHRRLSLHAQRPVGSQQTTCPRQRR